jgi:hypothetical protein
MSGGGNMNVIKMFGAIFGVVFLLCLYLGFAPSMVNPSKPSSKPLPDAKTVALSGEQTDRVLKSISDNDIRIKVDSAPTAEPIKPADIKKEYIASTKKIGGKKAPIYYKEFLKSPQKFEGIRVKLLGKIMNIEEVDGKTSMQLQVTNEYDSIIVHYPSTVKAYKGDYIMVYGEGRGVQEGVNRMGASMTWPVVQARYVVKTASED